MIKASQVGNPFVYSHDLNNPLIPMSDQDRISPYYINNMWTRLEMRIEKNQFGDN